MEPTTPNMRVCLLLGDANPASNKAYAQEARGSQRADLPYVEVHMELC